MNVDKKYSLEELLQMFDLDVNMTSQDLLICKKKVLMMHPDKSPHLPPSYFIAYKRALDQIVQFYREMHRTETVVPHDRIEYQSENGGGGGGGGGAAVAARDHKKTDAEMAAERVQFSRRFNAAFEREFGHEDALQRSVAHNSWWFSDNDDAATTAITAPVRNQRELANAIENFRGMQMTKYKQPPQNSSSLLSNAGAASRFYDSPDTLIGGVEDDQEIEMSGADVFAKMRFESLRRVHRDETVISLPTGAAAGGARALTADALRAERANTNGLYLSVEEEQEVAAIWRAQEQQQRQALLDKKMGMERRMQKNEEANNRVAANLRLFIH